MMTLVLKHQDGSQETIKVDKNMSFSPKAGEQFYIDNSSGSKYTLNLVNGDSSVQLVFNTEPKIKLVFDGIVDLIKANDVENKTVLSVLNDSEGIKNLEQTVLNTEFKSDDVISSLRDLLNEGLATVDKVHGVIIDDFGSLTEALASAAAGGPTGDGSTTPSFTLDVPDTTFGGLGDRTLGTRTSRDFTSLNNTGTTVNTTITDATSEGDNGAGTNDVTTVVDDTATTNEDAAINIDVIANDTDVDSKSPVATVTQGANGTVTINADGTVKYTPNANFNGTDTFTYTNEEGNTGTVTVTVDAVNDAPVVQNVDLGSTLEDTSITFSKADLLANSSDIDGDELTITNISIDSAYGTIVDNGNGTYTFNPTANYSGDNLEINFTVSDGTTIDSATATINVKAVADLPIVSISINKNIQEEDDDSDSNLDENEIENYHSGDNCGTNLADKMVVDRELVMNEKIDLKEGNDTLILNKDINQVTIDLGEGNDEVIINGKINGTNNFDLGSGDDIIRINDVVTNNTHVLGGDGKDTLYLSGNQSDYIFNWQTNNNGMIEGSITDKIGGGTIQYNQMETLVFSDGSYIGQEPVISKVISENETYTVNISAALVDTDSSETLSVVINGVPTGATLSSDTYTLNDNGNNSWTVTVPAGATSISDSIKMTLPSPTNGFTLDIIARATESHDNADGLNYAEATDSFTKSIIEDPNTENAINKGDGSSSHWDVMETSDHDDVIVAGDNWNKVELEKGNDNLTIGNGDSTNWSSIDADKGNDNIKAGDDWAHIKLGDGNDTLQVGDAYADTDWSRIDAGSGDDIIKAGNNWDIIDGGSGNDTLVLTNEDIDLGNILSNTQIKSIENINLIDGQDQNISINLNDILNIQDNNNELKIFGDDGDKVTLEGEAWEKGTSSEGFTEYHGTGSYSNVKVLIDDDVSVDPDL